MNINGKTVLITGGASGIGLESAKQFLKAGCLGLVNPKKKHQSLKP